jgi:uncharacterized membrane protein YczE
MKNLGAPRRLSYRKAKIVIQNAVLFIGGIIGGFVVFGTLCAWYFAGFSLERLLQ